MDSFEFNKIAGAVLAALLLVFGSSTFLEIMSSGHASHGKPGYKLEVERAAATADSKTPAAPAFDATKVVSMIAQADVKKGASVFNRCKSCHLVDKSGKSSPSGPSLWDVVGRKIAGSSTYPRYSSAFKGTSGDWSYESLVKYLYDPRKFIPRNRMSFGGIKDEGELAAVVAYLRSLSDSPKALPN